MDAPQQLDTRVQFDFEVDFSNGGGLQGQRFRLDIDGNNIDDEALADYIVRDLRLLMVGTIRILNKTIIMEQHKRNTMPAMERERNSRTRIDLSHAVEDGMITYKGLPAPIICDFLSREQSRAFYDAGTEFHIGKIDMVANTGTYLDSPFHRFASGKDVSELDLATLADLGAVLVRMTGMEGRAISRASFGATEVRGKAVLVHTGWATHWRTDTYFEGHPFLIEDAAVYLKDAGATLIGIDSYNIDDTRDGRRPVHTTLLGADIPIVEHLCNLEQLPATGFRFTAAPVKVKGMGTFPVRAYATLSSEG